MKQAFATVSSLNNNTPVNTEVLWGVVGDYGQGPQPEITMSRS